MGAMRKLGKCGLQVSEVGLGCWAIGGPSFSDDGFPNGWAGNDDDMSIKGLFKAYELGIHHWDSADAYGKGHSERLIGKAFQSGVSVRILFWPQKSAGSRVRPHIPMNRFT